MSTPICEIVTNPLALALRDALRQAADLEVIVGDVERRLAAHTATIAAEVLSRKDEAGKPTFGNDAARKAAIEEETATNPYCAELSAKLADLRWKRAYAQADAEALKAALRLAFGQMLQGSERL